MPCGRLGYPDGPLTQGVLAPALFQVAEEQGRELGRDDASGNTSETVRYLMFTIAQVGGFRTGHCFAHA